MHYYTTSFDVKYLYKGISLYESLLRHEKDFHLYVLALDEKCKDFLTGLALSNMTIVSLSDIETKQLLDIKNTRNKVEYYWTCGPTSIIYMIIKFDLPHCVYLDADLYFFQSADSIFQEIGSKSIGITEHFIESGNYPEGRYCVQFMYFKNDKDGLEALNWWESKCIDWCFARFEDGKYGDQKYLDEFPSRFSNVHVLLNRGAGVAPWNVKQYHFVGNREFVYNNQRYPLIFFHFHGIRAETSNNTLGIKALTYDISEEMKKHIFLPYLEQVQIVYDKYFQMQFTHLKLIPRNFHERVFSLIRKTFKEFRMAQFVYYVMLGKNYKGYEKKQDII